MAIPMALAKRTARFVPIFSVVAADAFGRQRERKMSSPKTPLCIDVRVRHEGVETRRPRGSLPPPITSIRLLRCDCIPSAGASSADQAASVEEAVRLSAVNWDIQMAWCSVNLDKAIREQRFQLLHNKFLGRLVGIGFSVGSMACFISPHVQATHTVCNDRSSGMYVVAVVMGLFGLTRLLATYDMDPHVRRSDQSTLISQHALRTDRGFASLRHSLGDGGTDDAIRRSLIDKQFLTAQVGADLRSLLACDVELGLWPYVRSHGQYITTHGIISKHALKDTLDAAPCADNLRWAVLVPQSMQWNLPDAIDLLSAGLFPSRVLRRAWSDELQRTPHCSLQALDAALQVRNRWQALLDADVVNAKDLRGQFVVSARTCNIMDLLDFCGDWLLLENFAAVVPNSWRQELREIQRKRSCNQQALAVEKLKHKALKDAATRQYHSEVEEARALLSSTERHVRQRIEQYEQQRARQNTPRVAQPVAPARDGDCTICLEPVTGQREWHCRHCGNPLHRRCAEQWLRTHQTCPTCRAEVQLQSSDGVVPIAEEAPDEAQRCLQQARHEFEAVQQRSLRRRLEEETLADRNYELVKRQHSHRIENINENWKTFLQSPVGVVVSD